MPKMHDMIAEGTTGLVIKSFILIFAWFASFKQSIAEISHPEQYIDRAFDTAFSLGLLLLFVIYMVYENRKKDARKDQVQSESIELLRTNIEVIKSFSQSNKDVVKSVERSHDATEKAMMQLSRENSAALISLTDAINKLESKI